MLWESTKQHDDNYTIIDNILYSFKNANAAALEYLRILQSFKYRKSAIERAHNEVGHMSLNKTYLSLLEYYT